MGKPTLRNGHCAGFWSLHPHHIYKLTQSFRNWVCPILKWNGQRPPTNSSDCWTQFSSCVPTLLHDDGNWSSSNRCLLISTQNNKVQTLECPRVTYYIQKALELVQYFSNLIAPFDTDEQPGACSFLRFALLELLYLLLPLAVRCSVWRALLLVAFVPFVSVTLQLTICWRIQFPVYLEADKTQQNNVCSSVKCLCN